MGIVTQLKELILDDDFTNIQSLVNEEINLMSILNVAHRELQHSNFLAWLFKPNETHGLNDFFLKEFIKLYFKENEFQDLGANKSSLSVFDFVDMDFKDLVIKREHKNIDLLILSKSNNLCIVIENKIYSKEKGDQLVRYRKYVEKELTDYKHKIFIYLSLFEQDITKSEKEYYILITYKHIKKILETILEKENISISKNTKFVLEQYLQTLKSLMNENDKIEKIAQELYKKYKPAFDLVFKYASPNKFGFVPNNLIELVKNEPKIKFFNSNNSYVRFHPNFLFENIEYLKNKKIMHQNDTIENNWLFLFEFHITRDKIDFDFKIGSNNHNQEGRRKLFDLFNNYPEFTNPRNKLSNEWHSVYQRKIVTKKEYEDFMINDDTNLEAIITERFNEVINTDLPKIERIIMNSQ